MKRPIRLGDMTSHGGCVTSVSCTTATAMGKPLARVGDQVSCPIRGHGPTVIVEGDPDWIIDGRAVALDGHRTACGAALIASVGEVERG
ncbi:PAAR domain-containing protein [Derxia gummosa]|uniref:PAAR domain-containing protein n=1 Tax=Derxia gummosa DSM 723 TaxID=1121388 RepID=A0A8B6X0L1_9BURK|nr:PAAR domain-containing protein [Derxia gummosa]